MDNLSLAEAQKKVDEWIHTYGVRYFEPLTNLGILMEETGELARIMVRQFGEQSAKPSDLNSHLKEEMADVLWVLLCLANQCNVNLTDALRDSFEKKTQRDANRHRDNKKLK